MTAYAELAVTSNFSFLRGASHPHELVETAARLGYRAIAIADRNSLAGIVRAHSAAKKVHIPLLVGARLVLRNGFETLCFPKDRAAYGRLAKLLSTGNLRAEKGQCHLDFDDFDILEEDHIFVALPPYRLSREFETSLAKLKAFFSENSYLAATRLYQGNDNHRLEMLDDMAHRYKAPLVATNDVHFHSPNRRPLQDILTCIREHCTIAEAGLTLHANAERYLKPPEEMHRLFHGYEEAVERTIEIAVQCSFSLNELAYEYPDEPYGQSASPQEELERLTWAGAKQRFPNGLPAKIKNAIDHELALIAQLNYAPYFLTVDDIVRFARNEGILCQGRGSAANSVVCFCLEITSVDPTKIDLLFERFISAERNEPPDIDVDFEHERREEVIQYIYKKYGRHRASITATVVSYRTRSAIREVGKAMGLSVDTVSALAESGWGWSSKPLDPARVKEMGFDPEDRILKQTLTLTEQLLGFPRHLSQHVGGFVITRGPLEEVVPIANAAMDDRTHVEWDKDDLDELGILKIDVLSLGMLTCIRKAFDLILHHYGKGYDLATVPAEDPRVYDMICQADTIGVFQIESRAQMSMLPRLRPRTFYDLVIEIAIVRPGPIQGDMVHPYLRRRQGLEPVDYPSQELKRVLHKTLGVPLFQEQAMNIAIIGAGFSPGKADALRRAMATFRRTGTIGNFREDFIDGMMGNGYTQDFAERCFKQIEGFSDYGFPESHSASFALLAYVSSWLKCFYPDVFACALLNSQPMGFYSSSSIVRDFREHKGHVLAVDINHSNWDHTLERFQEKWEPVFRPETRQNNNLEQGSDSLKTGAALEAIKRAYTTTEEGGNSYALRLGLRQIKGFKQEDAERIEAMREAGFDSVRDLYFRTGLSVRAIEKLARADAFNSLGLNRRDALWAVQGLGAPTGDRSAIEDLPLYASALDTRFETLQREQEIALPPMTIGQHVTQDYDTLKLSLKAHPVSLVRDHLDKKGLMRAQDLMIYPVDRLISIAGLVLVRQRPGTASGVIFATLEDETGTANVIIWPKVFETHRRIILGARFLGVKGILQREQSVIHVIARDVIDLTPDLDALERDDRASASQEISQVLDGPASSEAQKTLIHSVLPKGRNFH